MTSPIAALLSAASIDGLNAKIYAKILETHGYDAPAHFQRLTRARLEEIGITKIGHIEAIMEAAKPAPLPPVHKLTINTAVTTPPMQTNPGSPSLSSPSSIVSPASRNRLEALKARISGSPLTPSSRARADDEDKDDFDNDASSVFHLKALLCARNPWLDRTPTLMTPHQVSSALDSAYVTFASLQKSRLFRAKPGDVIVSGVQRCGQMAILLLLDALRRGGEPLAHRRDLVERVEWIEAAYTQPDLKSDRRLLKSYLTLRSLLSENAIEGKFHSRAKEFKIVCVLRDPLYIRRSWYEHAHRVYRFFNPDATWDFTVDDWAKVPVASYRMSVDTVPYDYEHYILEVIELVRGKHPNIKVVFYEDFLANPFDVCNELQAWTQLGSPQVCKSATEQTVLKDSNHPLSEARAKGLAGSHYSATHTHVSSRKMDAVGFMVSKKGDEYSTQALQAIDGQWDSIIKTKYKELTCYEALFEQISGRKWPFGAHRVHVL